MKITEKDWDRMLDLVLSGKDGAGTASVIKNKEKAIARFIAGLKLDNANFNTNENPYRYNSFWGSFSEFGNKAIELGATLEEIQEAYNTNQTPKKYSDQLVKLAGKNLNNRFVGSLSKAVLDAGFDIDYLSYKSGTALTYEGKNAMSRNGRKWTIGYKTEIDLGDRKVKLAFDAITDEGDGPTSFVIYTTESDDMFHDIFTWNGIGKATFVTAVMNKIKPIKD